MSENGPTRWDVAREFVNLAVIEPVRRFQLPSVAGLVAGFIANMVFGATLLIVFAVVVAIIATIMVSGEFIRIAAGLGRMEMMLVLLGALLVTVLVAMVGETWDAAKERASSKTNRGDSE